MFVEASSPVVLPIGVARMALERALAGGALLDASQRGLDAGVAALRHIGPRGAHGPNKTVVVRSLPSRRAGDLTITSIRWEAVGVTGRLFPALDADVCLNRVNDVTSLVSLVGRYSPPFGRIGEVIDRAVLSAAAQASVDEFVRELAASLRHTSPTGRADAVTVHL